jgi:hypothetical protein
MLTLSHTITRPLRKDSFMETGSRPDNTKSSGASMCYVMVTRWEIMKISCRL